MQNFELTPEINIIDRKSFINSITAGDKQKFNDFFKNALIEQNNCCIGCGSKKEKVFPYIISGSANDIDRVKMVVICKWCYVIKNFELAVKKNWILLVNSKLPQKDIINFFQNNSHISIKNSFENKIMIKLRKTASEYLSEIKESNQNRNEKIKLCFTEELLTFFEGQKV